MQRYERAVGTAELLVRLRGAAVVSVKDAADPGQRRRATRDSFKFGAFRRNCLRAGIKRVRNKKKPDQAAQSDSVDYEKKVRDYIYLYYNMQLYVLVVYIPTF